MLFVKYLSSASHKKFFFSVSLQHVWIIQLHVSFWLFNQSEHSEQAVIITFSYHFVSLCKLWKAARHLIPLIQLVFCPFGALLSFCPVPRWPRQNQSLLPIVLGFKRRKTITAWYPDHADNVTQQPGIDSVRDPTPLWEGYTPGAFLNIAKVTGWCLQWKHRQSKAELCFCSWACIHCTSSFLCHSERIWSTSKMTRKSKLISGVLHVKCFVCLRITLRLGTLFKYFTRCPEF